MHSDLPEFFERFCCWLLFWGSDLLSNPNKFEMENPTPGWSESIYVCSVVKDNSTVVKDNSTVVICNSVSLIDCGFSTSQWTGKPHLLVFSRYQYQPLCKSPLTALNQLTGIWLKRHCSIVPYLFSFHFIQWCDSALNEKHLASVVFPS